MYAGALLCSGLWNVRSSSSLVRSASCAEKYTGRALICCWHTISHYTIAVTARRLALAQLELAFLKSNYLAAFGFCTLAGICDECASTCAIV
jgi:phage gp46-like protein